MSLIKTPIQTSNVELAQNHSDKYWKLVLPFKEINYKGRKIKFNESYMNEAIRAFNDKVTGDQTAFQLANDKNEHYTDEDKQSGRYYDPERYRGEFDEMEIRKDRSDGLNGLWARLAPTEDGNKLITNNAKLGVSASIEENVDYEGKTYPVVVRHVLGTLDPKIRGTGLWEKAELSLSNESDKDKEVIDLTGTETPPKEDEKKESEKVEVNKEDWDKALKFIADKQKEEEDANKILDEWTETSEEDETEESTDLSTAINKHPRMIQLSNTLAVTRFDKKADEWRRAGVPNSVIEKARGVLSDGSVVDNTINLSNGTNLDTNDFIIGLIDEFKGTIDLSSARTSQRSQEELDKATEEEKMEEEFVNYFKKLDE